MSKMFAAVLTMALLLTLASSASGAFGLRETDVTFTNADGSPATQAGSHPFAMTTVVEFNTKVDPVKGVIADGSIKDVIADLPPGFAVDPNPVPRCSNADFLLVIEGKKVNCPDSTAIGVFEGRNQGSSTGDRTPVYNLIPPPGVASKLGFRFAGVSTVIEGGVRAEGAHNLFATVSNISQLVSVTGSKLTLWGNPADPAHDGDRGHCIDAPGTFCPITVPPRPFLTLPRSCTGPLATTFSIDSWQDPGAYLQPSGRPDLTDPAWVTDTTETHDNGEPPNPLGMSGCGKLGFSPSIKAQPTSRAANSPSGLDFSLDVNDEGLTNPSGLAASDIKKTVVTLPEGFTANPSIAEGLEVCTEAQLEAETAFSAPGAGCPNASKIGTVEVETPLLEGELLKGSLYIAKPYENPFDSLLALYIVIKSPELGIVVKQAAKVDPDPTTGQLVTTAEDMPQLPFSHFRLHFREGARSPLATPSACGAHTVKAVLTPWSGGAPTSTTSTFQIITGPDTGPCPSGGLPPFKPGLMAGTLNNAAAKYSPFNLRLFRSDSEQEFTRFSIKLPPGIVGKLAGIPYCSDAALEAAKQRTGTAEELNPSCPKASEVGRTLVGAGVGPSPAYAPGKLYLAGPYNNSALSIAAITSAKVGPFDLGTVVVRQALKIDRETAEVFIDATGSDPIPHIIDGVVVHARDIRAYVDRPEFVLNPTSCEKTSTASTVLGSGLNFASEADDNPVVVSSPFQAADCASLPFNPKLSFKLSGGTRRGAHPKLRAVVQMRPGEANIAKARVTLPRSAFLDQGHIGTVCTRVQYAADACPARSIYGYAKAVTPLFDTPVEGPVYLRSSEHKLPDLVAALRNGQIKFDLVGRIDSLKGRIRNAFELVPDAPVSSAVFSFQGGNKGLIINSTNLCKGRHRAIVELDAHSGKAKDFRPLVKAAGCGKASKSGKRKRRPRPRPLAQRSLKSSLGHQPVKPVNPAAKPG